MWKPKRTSNSSSGKLSNPIKYVNDGIWWWYWWCYLVMLMMMIMEKWQRAKQWGCVGRPIYFSRRERCNFFLSVKLTIVMFAFTHTYTLVKTNIFGFFPQAYIIFFEKCAKTPQKWGILTANMALVDFGWKAAPLKDGSGELLVSACWGSCLPRWYKYSWNPSSLFC